MHVLITRPEGDGEALKAQIEQLGCRATLAPLISIVSEAIPLSAIAGATALIVTSRNALKALAASPALGAATSLPLFAVGPGTAALARELGFQGRTRRTRHRRRTRADCSAPMGEGQVAPSFTSRAMFWPLISKRHWREKALPIKTVTAYRAVAAESLSPAVTEALRNRDIDAVILMSPRTAEAWARLARRSSDASGPFRREPSLPVRGRGRGFESATCRRKHLCRRAS